MDMTILGTSIDEIIKLELQEEYHSDGKVEFLSTSKYHDKSPGLFEAEF